MLDLSGMPNRLRNCSATVRECCAGRAATCPSLLIIDPNCCKNISAAATPAKHSAGIHPRKLQPPKKFQLTLLTKG